MSWYKGGNSLLHDKFLDWSKLKVFADNKINEIEIWFEKSEILWEKEKMLVTSIFSFSHNVLIKALKVLM